MTENFIPDPLSPLERRKHRPISSWPYVRLMAKSGRLIVR